jgi:hypothetical protein
MKTVQLSYSEPVLLVYLPEFERQKEQVFLEIKRDSDLYLPEVTCLLPQNWEEQRRKADIER